MREIKFIAWDKERKKMVPPGWWGVQSEDGRMFDNEANYLPFEPKERFVVMQYTGLKDKNGKEIYEGDIIKPTNLLWTWEVRYIGSGFVGWADGFTLELVGEDVEVIGNIYENPELLEVK